MLGSIRRYVMALPAPEIAPRRRNRRSRQVPATLLSGTLILGAILVLAAAAPLIAPYAYDEMNILARFKPPSAAHWLGTDEFGRDVLSRVLIGGRLSLLMGFGATVISLVIGVPLGLL